MKSILLFLGVLLACTLVAAAPYSQSVLESEMRQSPMSVQEQLAYQAYIEQDRLVQEYPYEFDINQAVDVQCPVGTRGLSIPPAHVNFWKQIKLTRGFTWTGANKFMCVPAKLRTSLNPIIVKLKNERIINVDPLTVPTLMREIGTVSPIVEDIDMIDERQQQQWMLENLSEQELQQMGLIEDVDTEYDSQGKKGGFGGYGYGKGLGYGAGLGYGLGYGRLGYGLGWGFPGVGLGYGGFGYGGLGLGLGYGNLGYGGLGGGRWGGYGLGGRGWGVGRRGRWGLGGRRGVGRWGGFGDNDLDIDVDMDMDLM